MNNRVLYLNDGTIEDASIVLSNYASGVKTISPVKNRDCIYIGTRLPFNHIYFKMESAQIVTPVMKVEYYTGQSWQEVVEVLDETEGFTKSGFIQFTPNRGSSWSQVTVGESNSPISGLGSKVIYDLYWIKLSFDADLVDVDLGWVGSLFSNDTDLGTEYPDLVRATTLTSFKVGKTNWEEQHARAASILIDDLVNKGIILGKEQILDWREFTNASICKVAELAFNAFGDDYIDNTVNARKEYNERLSKRFYRVDKNNNAIEEPFERHNTVGYFTR